MDAEEEVASPSPDIDQKPPPPYLDLPTYKDEEFWFDDGGTVTLVASGFAFRVYKGILATHSPVFADMFSLPQPPSEADAVVHLEDSAMELRHVLRALFTSKQTKCVSVRLCACLC